MEQIRDNLFQRARIKYSTNLISSLLIFAFLVHIYLRNIVQVNSPDLVPLAIAGVAFLMLDIDESLAFYMFLLPFKTGIGMHAITLLFCIICLFKIIKAGNGKISGQICFLLPIVILEFINTSIASFDIPELLRFSSYLIWMYISYIIMRKNNWNNTLIAKCSISFIVGLTFASLVVIYINSKGMSLERLLSGNIRIGKTSQYNSLDSMIISFHVNDLSLFCSAALGVLLLLIQKNWLRPLLGYLWMLYFVVVGILTQSRAFILTVAILIIFAVMTRRKHRLYIIFGLALVGIGIYFLYSTGRLPVIDELLIRFRATDMATGNGRTDLIVGYNNLIIDNLARFIIGFGVIDYRSYTTIGSAHNGTQEMLVCLGVIGSIFLILWFYYYILAAIHTSNYSSKEKLFSFLPLITVVFGIQSTQFVSQYHIFCILTLCCMLSALNEE